MFTDPPLARVGLSEGDAHRQGIFVRVANLPMSSVLRTEATEETQGFMKVVVDDRILWGKGGAFCTDPDVQGVATRVETLNCRWCKV